MTAPQQRPRAVTAAFWCWLVASVLLILGGLIVAFASLPPLSRGGGFITGLAGAGMAFLAGRSRSGDTRYRRAAVALSLAIVVLMPLVVMFGVVHVLTLLGVLLLIAGTVLITRPVVASWFDSKAEQ
jgi:hypothetical protein